MPMNFGEKLNLHRKQLNLTLKQLSNETGIDVSVLSKFENESRYPNELQLSKLGSTLGLNKYQLVELEQLSRRGTQQTINPKENLAEPIKINYDRHNPPIIYTDSAYITVNQFGLTLDFTQPQGEIIKQDVVSRIGMSTRHAKLMAQKIIDLLDTSENQIKKEDRGGDAGGQAVP